MLPGQKGQMFYVYVLLTFPKMAQSVKLESNKSALRYSDVIKQSGACFSKLHAAWGLDLAVFGKP